MCEHPHVVLPADQYVLLMFVAEYVAHFECFHQRLALLTACAFPQVPRHEVGALQGAADTVRTVAGIVGAPLISRAFGYCISDGRNVPGGALLFASAFSFLGAALATLV
jgi:hypothetical protein